MKDEYNIGKVHGETFLVNQDFLNGVQTTIATLDSRGYFSTLRLNLTLKLFCLKVTCMK